ncbi:MAG: Stk1 family PASTA domain-containing Ser/Thr kinase [Actinomycetales bacterium]|nr:Stk1 family PASTA domain-containing Ser/Thr kinase [Actinomycetales bacterium]
MTTDPGASRMLGDRYQIGEVIGRGGMAEVHEGRDLRLGRRVAVKILRPDLAKDPTFQARFRREAQSAAALNHPNIVAVYDTGEDALTSADGNSVTVPYIVMEFVDGMTLRQLLASGRRLLPERALEITSGILSALDYAHRHGIVHRDIKPANVMLTRTGDVKVMDFGIARAVNDAGSTMTATSAVMGTAQYLSPEQARGEVVDARSDLYSAGVLLYELLTGRPPFTGESPVSIAYQHVSEMPVPPSQVDSGVSPEIDAVVLHALAKRTDDRYQTAADFRADVERAIAGSPVTAAVPMVTADKTTMMPPVQAAGGVYEPMYDLDRPRRKRSVGFWALSIVGIAAAIIGALLIGRFVFGDTAAKQVQVPNLEGLTIEQATTTLQDYQLKLGAQTPETSDRPVGTVTAQQPAAGETIEQGQSVNVTVSSGLEQVTVPQLIALTSVEAARIALEDAGLQLGGIKERNSAQPAGYVLAQDPEEGTQLDAGSSVDITVSSGLIKVPDVVGSSEAQARSDLAQQGFDVQVVDIEDGTVPSGTVLAQSPKGGELLPRGSVVTITVSNAPPQPTPTPTPTPTDTPTPAPVPSTFAPSP